MNLLEKLHLGSGLGRPEAGMIIHQVPLYIREKWLTMPMTAAQLLAGTGIDEETTGYFPSISGMLSPLPEPSEATKKLFRPYERPRRSLRRFKKND